MRRFIVLTLLGGVAALAGHAVVSFGLHPERLAPVAILLQGCVALVIGAALFGTGLLGLADGYGKLASRVDALLLQKELTSAGTGIPVMGREDLSSVGQQFWRGYSSTGIGLSLFLAGLLAATAALAHTSPDLFTIGVGSATVILTVVAATVSIRGLRRLRAAHVGVDNSVRQLSRLPDRRRQDDAPPARRRRPARVTLFPRAASTGLDRRFVPRESRAVGTPG
ncbi:MAG: hypothetical protein O2782_01900 [bacterium]|nr:hypothetical protein [bacterium]